MITSKFGKVDEAKDADRGTFTADRRLYLDADGRVVEHDDPSKARLLVPAGGTLPMKRARELGLLDGGDGGHTVKSKADGTSHGDDKPGGDDGKASDAKPADDPKASDATKGDSAARQATTGRHGQQPVK